MIWEHSIADLRHLYLAVIVICFVTFYFFPFLKRSCKGVKIEIMLQAKETVIIIEMNLLTLDAKINSW